MSWLVTMCEMKRIRLKTGDILQLPFSDGMYAVAQIVLLDFSKGAPMNPLLRVVKGRFHMDEEIDLDIIDLSDQLFPPIITGVGGAVKAGYWNKIGHRPVENFRYPTCIQTNYSQDTGEAGTWYLRDETGTYILGKELPEELKNLEYDVILDPHSVSTRIETGEISFPYGDLIKYNKFTPIEQPRYITKEEKEAFRKEFFGKR